MPAASGGVSVATGTAGVALLLVVSDEGGIRGPCCRLNRRDRHFPGASPPVASGRLRSPPATSGGPRSRSACAKGIGVRSGGTQVGMGGLYGVLSAYNRVFVIN